MKIKPPIKDPHFTGLDHYAMVAAIAQNTGMGEIPKGIGGLGWFGKPGITTMLCERDDIESLVVRYIKLNSDGSYSFYYNRMGDIVTCSLQTLVVESDQMGSPDVVTYLDLIDSKTAHAEKILQAKLSPSVMLALQSILEDQDWQGFEITCQQLNLDPDITRRVLVFDVAKDIAMEDHEDTQATKEISPYLLKIQNGVPIVQVISQMHDDGIDQESIDALIVTLDYFQNGIWPIDPNKPDLIN